MIMAPDHPNAVITSSTVFWLLIVTLRMVLALPTELLDLNETQGLHTEPIECFDPSRFVPWKRLYLAGRDDCVLAIEQWRQHHDPHLDQPETVTSFARDEGLHPDIIVPYSVGSGSRRVQVDLNSDFHRSLASDTVNNLMNEAASVNAFCNTKGDRGWGGLGDLDNMLLVTIWGLKPSRQIELPIDE